MTPQEARDRIMAFVDKTKEREGLKVYTVFALSALAAAAKDWDDIMHGAPAMRFEDRKAAGNMLIAMAEQLPEVP